MRGAADTTRATVAALAIAALWALAVPGGAAASSTQLSLLQDDAAYVEGRYGDLDPLLADAAALGVDVIRANVIWAEVAPAPRATRPPAGFDATDPNAPGYRFDRIDRLVGLAARHGLGVMLTPTGWIPRWASTQPRRCRPGRRCAWKPSARAFGRFVTALARRYSGRVQLWSVWNEPNLGGRLAPQVEFRDGLRVRTSGRLYRGLWLAAYRAIARWDPGSARSVLFGETAPVGSPLLLLRAALCMDARGRALRGRLRLLQGCRAHPGRLPVGGFSHHPYTPGAVGSLRRSFARRSSVTITYLPRLHTLIRLAARARRIPRGVGIWSTEFGFQTRPPEPFGLRPAAQAVALNEADRLLAEDPGVRSVAQYELIDDSDPMVFNTGLRFRSLAQKPSYAAYRLPIVVTRTRSRDVVRVWGWVRPARASELVTLTLASGTPVATPATNARGQFTVTVRMRRASRQRFRLEWLSPAGELVRSRTAAAGAPLRFRR